MFLRLRCRRYQHTWVEEIGLLLDTSREELLDQGKTPVGLTFINALRLASISRVDLGSAMINKPRTLEDLIHVVSRTRNGRSPAWIDRTVLETKQSDGLSDTLQNLRTYIHTYMSGHNQVSAQPLSPL